MTRGPALTRTYAVVFGHRAERRWWDVFTRPGFRHVWILSVDERFGGTTVLHCGWDMFAARWSPSDVGVVAREIAEKHAGIVLLVETKIAAAFMPRPFLTCVEVAKHALGIKAPLVLTPYQLYRHLRARGALMIRIVPRNQDGG